MLNSSEIPIAIYKLVATGLPVCPTCSLWGRHPKSDTGFEQAVAAPSTSASSSIIPQFSGPLRPLPPETTMSASAMVSFPETLSILVTLMLRSASDISTEKEVIVASVFNSLRPKEFPDKPMTLTGVFISV